MGFHDPAKALRKERESFTRRADLLTPVAEAFAKAKALMDKVEAR